MPFMDVYILFILLSAIASSLVFFQKNKVSKFWYFFPFFLFAAFGVEYTGIGMAYKGESNTTLYNIFTVIEFVFYFWMFSYFIHNTAVKAILRHLLWVYPLLFLINKCYIQTGEQFHTITASLGSILIILCTVYYFYELFKAKKVIDLLHEPAFWISSGLLFFYSCVFPLNSLSSVVEKFSTTAMHNLLILLSWVNILLYSSFIVAFLCRTRLTKFSSYIKGALQVVVLVFFLYQHIFLSVKKYWQKKWTIRKLARFRVFARLFT